MKTRELQLFLYVFVLTAALFGSGCTSTQAAQGTRIGARAAGVALATVVRPDPLLMGAIDLAAVIAPHLMPEACANISPRLDETLRAVRCQQLMERAEKGPVRFQTHADRLRAEQEEIDWAVLSNGR